MKQVDTIEEAIKYMSETGGGVGIDLSKKKTKPCDLCGERKPNEQIFKCLGPDSFYWCCKECF